jgi:hypothetical protein
VSTVSFEALVENSVSGVLSRVLGETVWKSISFYFDMKSLSKDPDRLPEVLSRLFGAHGSVLEKVIADDVLRTVGVVQDAARGYDFRAFIRVAKARFMSSATRVSSARS